MRKIKYIFLSKCVFISVIDKPIVTLKCIEIYN